jgi:hypothetical protein
MEWKVFEKLDTGKWEARQWVMCRTMAKNVGLMATVACRYQSVTELIAAFEGIN